MNLHAIAFQAYQKVTSEMCAAACLASSHKLPFLLRAHGLAATLGYWISESASDAQGRPGIAKAFVGALDQVCPISGAQLDEKVKVAMLKDEPLSLYLVHSRLALRLADAWVMVVRAESIKSSPAPGDGNA